MESKLSPKATEAMTRERIMEIYQCVQCQGEPAEFFRPIFTRSVSTGLTTTRVAALVAVAGLLASMPAVVAENVSPLPGTGPLMQSGDIASQLVEGVDLFLLRQLDRSVARRRRHWQRDLSSSRAYDASIEPNRQQLAHYLGVRDERIPFAGLELVGTTARPALIGRGESYDIFAVRWPAFGDVHGEGLLLVPRAGAPVADIVAIPDAGQTPRQCAGLVEGMPAESQFARRLAESGCRVVVPLLIDRTEILPGLTQREYLYRSAYELGRHLIGYEVQKVLALVDWYSREGAGKTSLGVLGWGEGGLLGLYSAALDTRIDAACISGYINDRLNVWQEPLDRNVFGLLDQFGDAELATMVAPRRLIVEAARGPQLTLSGGRGAPARLVTPNLETVKREITRARKLVDGLNPAVQIELVISEHGRGPYGSKGALQALLTSLVPGAKLADNGPAPQELCPPLDPRVQQRRQVHELDRHNQRLLGESAQVRQQFMAKVDTDSRAHFAASIEDYRTYFREEVIGQFDRPLLAPQVRTRKTYEREKWTGYEVVMDVYPDVIAYGILLLPNDLQAGEKRPVVVCQHGLEGRPQHLLGKEGYRSYRAFAARLAERGFITFAPQNLYLFHDRFRTLQRKANPLKKTLFSIIVPQHQQIVDWLQTLPCVDPQRIAFYGLSYGGKTAMRVPPLVTDYCLSICSGDFNEWIDKNASTHNPLSYVTTGEYEIFEFDLGSTFNYAEMAMLIAPRPFMVERGHHDGVARDPTVAWEFAKVRYLYAARLGIPDRCQIEWFDGPHTIHGVGTFEFLHRHLHWPEPRADTRPP
jgi:dienelactone hydrolase